MTYSATTTRPPETFAGYTATERAAQDVLDASHRTRKHIMDAADAAMAALATDARTAARPVYDAIIKAAREAHAGELDGYEARANEPAA